jgi:hypothetical protein
VKLSANNRETNIYLKGISVMIDDLNTTDSEEEESSYFEQNVDEFIDINESIYVLQAKTIIMDSVSFYQR